MTDETIGYIGIGIIGEAMAKNFVDEGYEVVVYNRSPGPIEEMVEYGAKAADSPREVAQRSEVIFTALPDIEVVRSIVFGEDGIVEGVDGGETVVDVSTVSPGGIREVASRLAERGVQVLDAPISGGEPGAIAGTLSIMVGGEDAVLDANREVLAAVGATITYCGPQGSGQVAKACNQIVLGASLVGAAEALVFAEKAGVDTEAVLEAISGGAAACWVLDTRAPKMLQGDFEPGGYVRYLYEDLRVAEDAGRASGAPMFVTGAVQELLKASVERGDGERDIAAAIRVLEGLAGTKARAE